MGVQVAKRFRKLRLFNIVIAVCFVSACISVCHHGPAHEHTLSSAIVNCDSNTEPGRAQEVSSDCDCGHTHRDTHHDAHLCLCVCHVPGMSGLYCQRIADPICSQAPIPLNGADASGFRNRVERPPRIS